MAPAAVRLLICACAAAQSQSRSAATLSDSDALLPKQAFWQTGPVCGPNALYCLLRIFDKKVEYRELVAVLAPPDEGSSLDELRVAAEKYGLILVTYRSNRRGFYRLKTPFIAHLDFQDRQHYVLIAGWSDGGVHVFDPERAEINTVPNEKFFRAWSGYVLARGTRTWETVLCILILIEVLCLLGLIGLAVTRRRGGTKRS
jgi:hypothetical protein